MKFGDAVHTLAVISIFAPPNRGLFEQSCQTVYICHYLGNTSLKVINVQQIESVVAMVPDFKVTKAGHIETPDDCYFLVEKLGLGLTELLGEQEEDEGPENDESGSFVE